MDHQPPPRPREADDHTVRASQPVQPSFIRRLVVALLCVFVAFEIRYWLTPVLGDDLPFMLFIAAALVASWYGGAVTGIVALLLGLLFADFFFLHWHRPPGESRPVEVLDYLRYIFTAALGTVLIEVLHRSKRRTEAAVQKLETEIARRERSEAALQDAKTQLSRHADELERRVAERTTELASSVKSLQDLLYHIAHNLRGPLRAMEGYTTLLVREYGSKLDATAQEYSRQITQAACRMDALIHDLLDYGRGVHQELPLSEVNLQQTLDLALLRLGEVIRSTKAEITIDRPLPQVRAHPGALEQVLINLLDNAVKFVAPGTIPRIRIWTEQRGPDVRLWVQDNGLGVEPRYHERIFGAFERLNPAEDFEGTGIGLAIVRQSVERMHGRTGVESQPGQGSRFWLELTFSSM